MYVLITAGFISLALGVVVLWLYGKKSDRPPWCPTISGYNNINDPASPDYHWYNTGCLSFLGILLIFLAVIMGAIAVAWPDGGTALAVIGCVGVVLALTLACLAIGAFFS